MSTTEAMVCLAALASLRPEPTVMVELEAAASSTLKGGGDGEGGQGGGEVGQGGGEVMGG